MEAVLVGSSPLFSSSAALASVASGVALFWARWWFARPYAAFLDLPDSVIIEILCFIDPRSIIAVRQLCRRCSYLTRTFSVWSTAFQNLNMGFRGSDHRLERPINSYSATEMEAIVWKKVRLDDNLASSSPSPVRIRPISVGYTEFVELVCGGRWLITGSDDGSGRVWYRDLQAESITPRVLLQWVGDDPCDAQRVGFSMDGESDQLSFTVAVVFSTEAWNEGDKSKTMSIWAVDITDDGAQLDARLLNSFDVPGQECFRNLLIYGDTLVWSWADEPFIEALDWPRCNSDTHSKAVLRTKYIEDWKAIRVLPNRRILAVSAAGATLYEVKAMTELTFDFRPDNVEVSLPIWQYPFLESSIDMGVAVSPQPHYRRCVSDQIPVLIFQSHAVHAFYFRSTSNFEAKAISHSTGTGIQRRPACLGWRWGMSWAPGEPSRTTYITKLGIDIEGVGTEDTSTPKSQGLPEIGFKLPMKLQRGRWLFDEQSGTLLLPAVGDADYHALHFI